MPEMGAGDVLLKNLMFSFDPTQRNWMVDRPSYLPLVAISDPMRAGSVSQVVASEDSDFGVGDVVQTSGAGETAIVIIHGWGMFAKPLF